MKMYIALAGTLMNIALAGNVALADTQPPQPVAKIEFTKNVVNDENETLLADFTGRTLYVFDMDQGKPAPVCVGDCAEVWPPYIINGAERAQLLAPLGTIARANGKLQLTYGGRPVYTYAFDRTVADDKGDGVGGVWHYIEIK